MTNYTRRALGNLSSDAGSTPAISTRKETPFVYRTKGVSFQRNKSLRICEMPAGVRGFISFHFPHKRKISQWPKVIISHPKDISLHNPSFPAVLSVQ